MSHARRKTLNEQRLWKNRIYWLALGLLALALAACQGPAWEDDPEFKAARIACAGLRKAEHLDCVEERAIAGLNPNVCRLAAAGLDEFCLRELFEAVEDPAICEQIYLPKVEKACHAWYAEKSP